ncbi:hypothetical protein MMC25_005241 [Agyrium rufum]|nr:hypothetical protein [Agyrium rufum]
MDCAIEVLRKATYAIYKLGAILVPLNPAFNPQQFYSALSHLGAAYLIISSETNLPWKQPRSNGSVIRELLSEDGDLTTMQDEVRRTLQHLILVDNSVDGVASGFFSQHSRLSQFNDLLHAQNLRTPLQTSELQPDEVVNIQFTSGTTSDPKAACLTHRSILNNGFSIGERMLLTQYDIVCCPPPLFHCFGCILGYMATATHGSAIVFPSEAFNPHAALLAVQEERCTALYGVPTMFTAELELLRNRTVSREGFQHLRTGIAAGSSIPSALMEKLHQELNLTQLTICYGMTETSPVSAMTTTDDPMEKRIDSVGRLLPHVDAKIVDPSDRKIILPIGERGELAVRGYLVMKGYWHDGKRTDEVMIPDEEGEIWMHTGDEASMDADGYIKITSRLKDLIIRGGENIHPLEIENCLFSHPSVAEVSVVGLKDNHYGEVVAAFIVLRDGEVFLDKDALRAWVRGTLSHHLVPKYIFSVDTLPKTASGKIQKFVLRDLGEQLRGDAELQKGRVSG